MRSILIKPALIYGELAEGHCVSKHLHKPMYGIVMLISMYAVVSNSGQSERPIYPLFPSKTSQLSTVIGRRGHLGGKKCQEPFNVTLHS